MSIGDIFNINGRFFDATQWRYFADDQAYMREAEPVVAAMAESQ